MTPLPPVSTDLHVLSVPNASIPAAIGVPRIVVQGAGSVGMFAGGTWAAAGAPVSFLGRRGTVAELAAHGLTLTDHLGGAQRLDADQVAIGDDPGVLASAGLVVVAVKATAIDAAAAELSRHLAPGVPVLALQNGLGSAERLRAALPANPVIAGLVSHNIAKLGPGHWHKGTEGGVFTERHAALDTLTRLAAASAEPIVQSDDFAGVQWGKLLVNLNNAVNAVSGLGLRDQFASAHWRMMTGAAIAEGLAVCRAAGITPRAAGRLSPVRLARMFRLPDWLFAPLSARILKVDANARTSMADDLAQGRLTEIDFLNGEIVRRAEVLGIAAPVNKRLVELIRALEKRASPTL